MKDGLPIHWNSDWKYMGVSLNGGTPNLHPKWSYLVGKPMGFVGETHHFRVHPHIMPGAMYSPSCAVLTDLEASKTKRCVWQSCGRICRLCPKCCNLGHRKDANFCGLRGASLIAAWLRQLPAQQEIKLQEVSSNAAEVRERHGFAMKWIQKHCLVCKSE